MKKKWKKGLALWVVVLALLALLPVVSAGAECYTPEEYFTFDAASGTITGYNPAGGNAVIIPPTIGGVAVTAIGANAFLLLDTITSVVVPAGVTSIGDSAFSGCYSLSSINIPTSVISIGKGAFSGCSITSITIPDGITSIGILTFQACEYLSSITLPDSVTSIGEDAFFGCTRLGSITIPRNVTSIGDRAFTNCTFLTSINILGDITRIGNSVFANCVNLNSVILPDSVTSIGDSAFSFCTELSSITIPAGVTSIGESAFSSCSNLVSITLPESLTSIGYGTFEGCSDLQSIAIPAGVTSIGHHAFYGCNYLTAAYFMGTAPSSMGSDVFYGTADGFKIYYPYGASGWTNPWNSYPTTARCTVTYDSRGGRAVAGVIVNAGGLIAQPAAPTKGSTPFAGWYREASLETPWNFDSDTVTENITLYAKWNTIPVRKAGIGQLAQAEMEVNTVFTLNLADIFEDTDGDPLTYKVSVDGAADITANESYSYTPTSIGPIALVFTANDGTADSDDNYILTLTAAPRDFSVTGGASGTDYTYTNNKLTFLRPGVYQVSMKSGVASTTTDRIVVNAPESSAESSVSITLNGVDVRMPGSCPFSIREDSYVNLMLTDTNVLISSEDYCAGLHVPSGAALTISGAGSLTAEGGLYGAGIGGDGDYGTCGTVTITGGTVHATGGSGGAGIGGGAYSGDSGTVTISGGSVTAMGGGDGAGIGGGFDGNGSTVLISGGTVTAIGNNFGAGIGGGRGYDDGCGNGGTVTISGGTVTAVGGTYGAGIGGGNRGGGGTVTLSDGVVFADGKNGGKDIGAGYTGSGGSLNLSGTAALFLRNDNSAVPVTTTHTHINYIGHEGGSIYGIPVAWTGSFGAYLRIYTFSYDVNSGSGTVATPATQLYSTTAAVSDGSGLSRANYTFAGWNTAANGGGTAYAVGTTFTFSVDTVLYAQWTATPFTLSYDLDGGAVNPTNPVSYTIESDAITLNNPTRDGCTFTGWSGTGITGTSISVSIPQGSTGNRSYTAHWTAVSTTGAITGTVTDGTNPVSGASVSLTVSGSVYSATTIANGSYSILDVPAGTGYTVTAAKSDYTSGSATNVNVTANTTTQNVNITLTAIPPTTHTVSVSANPVAGGNVTGGGTYNEGASVTVIATTNSGYTFTSWAAGGSPVSTNSAYTFTLGTSDRTLVANFTATSGTSRTVTVTSGGNGTATGGGTYNQGQSVTLGAVPAAGYNFDGWYTEDTKVSSLPNYSFTVTGDITLTVRFIVMQKECLEVTTVGNGVVKLNSEVTGLPINYIAQHTIGANITLTATPNSNNTFAYWQDNRSGSIISINPVYEFVMGVGVSLKAVFNRISDANTSEFTVIFKDKSGKILQSTNVAKNAAAAPPASPSLVGYSFTGWDKTFNNVTSDMTINALYERLPTTYMVTVVGGTLSTGGTSGSYKYDMPVTVVAGSVPAGQKFSHWEQDGVKISTNSSYSFFTPMRATTLTAVFVPAETEIVAVPFITLSQDVQVDTVNKNMLFTANRTVPAGYTLVESGVLLLKSNTAPAGEITVDTENVIRGKIKNDSTNQFYIRKNNITAGDTWYARAYLIYKDAGGNIITVYSGNTVNRTMN